MKNFTFLGLTMPVVTLIYGFFLVTWGAVVSIVFDSQSFTSWIPSFIGLPIILMGLLSIVKPKKTKVWSHIALIVGLLAFFGGLDFLRGLAGEAGAFENPVAGISKLMLLVSAFSYLVISFKSFVWARRNKI